MLSSELCFGNTAFILYTTEVQGVQYTVLVSLVYRREAYDWVKACLPT